MTTTNIQEVTWNISAIFSTHPHQLHLQVIKTKNLASGGWSTVPVVPVLLSEQAFYFYLRISVDFLLITAVTSIGDD